MTIQSGKAHLIFCRRRITRMDLYDHGRQKYVIGEVLGSAVGCDWSGVAAELRYHPPGELPPIDLAQTEIGIATASHPDTVVGRSGNGLRQSTRAVPGTIWTCPAGVHEEDISMNDWHECLHIYLPHARFAQLSEVRGGAVVTAHHISYLADIDDELIRQIGWTLLAELKAPTSAGRVLVETLALALTARLTQAHAAGVPDRAERVRTRHALDDLRVTRVIDYMAHHLDQEIGIDDLAAVACLSPFHFIRMFRRRMGMPPSRYLGRLRLERAKTLLARRENSLAEIAAVCRFSSQANFTRAFQRATGTTPGAYRHSLGQFTEQ
jgi:AraC family transcriptional regulator